MVGLTWLVITLVGWALALLSAISLTPDGWVAMGAPMAMIGVLVLISELRPIALPRLVGSPVSISLAFVFSAMYVWGGHVAIVLAAVAMAVSEVIERKPLWRLTYNVGQMSISVAAAWLVLVASGSQAAPTAPEALLTAGDLPWLIAAWTVYHLVNLALVAAMGPRVGRTWWESFNEDFWLYTVSSAAVLAFSPLVAVVATSYPQSWTLLPLLMVPLLALQRNAALSREREYRALHDPLTGLPNRGLFDERLGAALADQDAPGDVALVLLDMDHFKLINDALGHAAGDALLVGVARRLSTLMGPGQTLSRLSGDEFAVLCSGEGAADLDGLIDRVRDSLREPFHHERRVLSISVSMGVAVGTRGATPMSLVREADSAMDRAKLDGRDRVAYFDQSRHSLRTALLDDHLGLRMALERGELRAHYQPIVDMLTDEVVGVEALVRWQRPGRGLLGARQIIPLAEETGLIEAVGGWMIEHTIRQVRDWRQAGLSAGRLWAAVNVSGAQIGDQRIIEQIRSLLDTYQIPAGDLHLEITETSVMETEEASPALEGLRALGLSLIIDDFGTGHSSLARLKGLPVSAVKIDRSFIDGLATNAPDRSIVDAIVTMTRSMNLDVIAEGVQTQQQREMLLALGVRLGQGYLWVPPIPGPDLAEWLQARQVGSAGFPAT